MKSQADRDEQTIAIAGYLAVVTVLAFVAAVSVEVLGLAAGLVAVAVCVGAVLAAGRALRR